MPASRSLEATRRTPPGRHQQPKRDPGAYIGRLPERAVETIPDGLGPKDDRVAAVATQPGTVRGPAPAEQVGAPPGGHREPGADPAARREAGERR